MIRTLPIAQFLSDYRQNSLPLIDVRSPQEFRKGHIPGATNLPIFEDNERALIGRLYKQQGREEAVLNGLDIVGPKMKGLVRQLQQITDQKQVMVHCWRGGMRSESMAWLWHMAGYEVSLLTGGYKAYRRHVHETFAQKWDLRILGGSTGSGKTDILLAMAEQGVQVIDLEGLACHRGSAFGALGQGEQPQVEQFENDLYEALRQMDPAQPLWVEDESNAIGRIYIPQPFWDQMKAATVFVLELPLEARVNRLVRDYGHYAVEDLKESVTKIKKRLGGKRFQEALQALESGDKEAVVRNALNYYDKAYSYGLRQKPAHQLQIIQLTADKPQQTAQLLLGLNESHIITE